MVRSIIPQKVESKLLLIITAIVSKRSLLRGLEQVFVTTDAARTKLYPVDTGRKLNVHKTFRKRPGRLLNVLCTFNLRPVSTGYASRPHVIKAKRTMYSCILL